MAYQPGGPDWEHGSDGKWYAPGVLSGAGWWRAADGRWYAPTKPPPPINGLPPPPTSGRLTPTLGSPPVKAKDNTAIIAGVAGLVVVVIAFFVVVAVSAKNGEEREPRRSNSEQAQTPQSPSDGGDTAGSADTTDLPATSGPGDDPNPGALYPGRPDAQAEDQERQIGEAARLSGYTAEVESIESVQRLGTDYFKIHVTVANRDDSSQPVSVFDWRVQTPQGTVIDPSFTLEDGMLEGADLIGGGATEGDVYFEAGDERGTYFVIYKPDPFDAARGIWGVSAP